MDDDALHMRRALRLAARAAGRTSPNPLVGAVITKGGELLAEGYHHALGQAHAEVDALRKAGRRARGATVYVNLEPCAHHGLTPPCIDALREAKVARVVMAIRDPDPRTSGRGVRALRAAGIVVDEGLLAEEATTLNAGFLSRVRRGRPHVTVKLATTLDGRVAVKGRRYLTGKAALREVHRLRDHADAVLVGVGTVLADDPLLTVREVKGRDPLRVVVDADARTPVGSRVVHASDPQRTVIFVARDASPSRTKALRGAGVLLATAPRVAGGLDLAAALGWLGERGVNTVLCEGGPTVAGALLAAGLADRLVLYVAPIAGGDGRHALPDTVGLRTLRNTTVRRVGEDVAIAGDVVVSTAAS